MASVANCTGTSLASKIKCVGGSVGVGGESRHSGIRVIVHFIS